MNEFTCRRAPFNQFGEVDSSERVQGPGYGPRQTSHLAGYPGVTHKYYLIGLG